MLATLNRYSSRPDATTAPGHKRDRAGGAPAQQQVVEQWGVYEHAFDGPSTGNPFVDVELSAQFVCEDTVVTVDGFYDGDGVYRIRFMPPKQGRWTYQTRSNRPELNGKTGALTCLAPLEGNHGPVRVNGTFHFAYADGTAYRQVGTTCYAWSHQGDALEEQTLATLKASPFNKLRMCIFPKRYSFNQNEPPLYPFEGTAPNKWDFTRPNPEFFRHQEKRVAQLMELGIEADLILFHPYDEGHWGFDRMGEENDDRYLRYVIARFAAFRNVWWSLANEFDFVKTKVDSDWDRFFKIVVERDPYGHLRSIHNGKRIYDHTHPWVTHASIQNCLAVADTGRAVIYRDCYYKPVVYDEVKYEGNIEQRWGNISAEDMVHRFWQGTIAGTYVGHGETYLHPSEVLWWSKGGVLRGKSVPRLEFLRKEVLDKAPAPGLEPIDKWDDPTVCGKANEHYIIYFGKEKPAEWLFELPKEGLTAGSVFRVEILDTWDMTVTPVPGEFTVTADTKYRYHAEGMPKVKLPGKPWIAVRLWRVR